jgi:hypothetical protein
MKQSINLIPFNQKINLGLLSFNRMIVLTIMFVISLVILNVFQMLWREKMDSDIRRIALEISKDKILLTEIIRQETSLTDRHNVNINKIEDEGKRSKSQLQAYQTLSLNRDLGYEMMVGIKQAATPAVDIQEFELHSSGYIEIDGTTTDPQSLIEQLKRLQKQGVFQNKILSILVFQKQGEIWQFKLGSRVTEHE